MTRDELRQSLAALRSRLLDEDVEKAAETDGHEIELNAAIQDLGHIIARIDIADLADIQQRLAANEDDFKASETALKADLKDIEKISKILDGVTKVIEIAGKIAALV